MIDIKNTEIFKLLDIKPSAYIVIDSAGELVYCNDNFVKQFQHSKNNIITHLFTEFFFESDGDSILPLSSIQKKLCDNESVEMNACIRDGSHKIKPVKLLIRENIHKEGKNFITVKVTLNTSQTFSEKEKLKYINKSQNIKGKIDEVLKESAKEICEILEGFFVIIKVRDKEQLLFRSHYNLPQSLIDMNSIQVENSICKQIFSHKKPLCVSSTAEIDPPIDDPIIKDYSIASFIGVPLFNRNQEVVGILSMYDYNSKNYGPKDIKIMNIFATRIAEEINYEITNDMLNQAKNETSSGAKGKYGRINDVDGYVKKVSGIDINKIDTAQMSAKKSSAKSIEDKKNDLSFKSNTVQRKKTEQTDYENNDESEKKTIFKPFYTIVDGNSINWKNVNKLESAPLDNIYNLTELARNDDIGIGIISEGNLNFANYNFIKLEKYKITKIYNSIVKKNILTDKFIDEEKKNSNIQLDNLVNNYIIKMTSTDNSVIIGDITLCLFTIKNNKNIEIIFSKRNSMSIMMGVVGKSIASVKASINKDIKKEKELKDIIYKETSDVDGLDFKKFIDIVVRVTNENI